MHRDRRLNALTTSEPREGCHTLRAHWWHETERIQQLRSW